MKKTTLKILILFMLLLGLFGCGNVTKNITEKVVDTIYVTDYANVRAMYKFENTISEPLSNADTLLLLPLEGPTGSVATVVTGMFGNGLNFTGTNQRIVVSHNETLANYTDLEIDLWIKPDAVNAVNKTLVAKWATANEYEYLFQLNGTRLIFSTSYDGVAVRTYSSFADKVIIANKWNQVAVRFNGATVQFIINGASAGTFPVTTGIRKGNSPIQIGQRVTGVTPLEQYLGAMDSVRISRGFQADVLSVGIADSSSNKNNGSNFSLVSGVNSLDASQSLAFNGLTDYVCIGSNDSLSMSGAFTLEADVYPTGLAASQYLICKGSGLATTKFNYYLRLNTNRPTLGFQDEYGNLYEVSSVTTLVNNEWAKIAGVWDGEKITIYVNGRKDAELLVKIGTQKVIPAINGCPVMLGRQDYNALYYKGELDNVFISAVAKTF